MRIRLSSMSADHIKVGNEQVFTILKRSENHAPLMFSLYTMVWQAEKDEAIAHYTGLVYSSRVAKPSLYVQPITGTSAKQISCFGEVFKESLDSLYIIYYI